MSLGKLEEWALLDQLVKEVDKVNKACKVYKVFQDPKELQAEQDLQVCVFLWCQKYV